MESLLCRIFGHRRNVRHAYLTYRGWRCPCRHCGEQLLRVAPKRWLPLTEAEAILDQPALNPLPLFDENARRAPALE